MPPCSTGACGHLVARLARAIVAIEPPRSSHDGRGGHEHQARQDANAYGYIAAAILVAHGARYSLTQLGDTQVLPRLASRR